MIYMYHLHSLYIYIYISDKISGDGDTEIHVEIHDKINTRPMEARRMSINEAWHEAAAVLFHCKASLRGSLYGAHRQDPASTDDHAVPGTGWWKGLVGKGEDLGWQWMNQDELRWIKVEHCIIRNPK